MTVPSVCKGYREMLCSAAPWPARLLRRCCRSAEEEDEELAVKLAPRTQLSSARKGSATSGLTSAPRPMKKCKAWGETWRLSPPQRWWITGLERNLRGDIELVNAPEITLLIIISYICSLFLCESNIHFSASKFDNALFFTYFPNTSREELICNCNFIWRLPERTT